MTSPSELEVAIGKRWPDPAYAVLHQVANGTGAAKTRTADALVFGLWPSRGLEVEGVEIKRSRTDWRRELADPSKAAAFVPYCHRFWIVAPPDVVETGELPSEWGLLELRRGVLRQTVEAPKRTPEPIPHRMWLAIMRNLRQTEIAEIARNERRIRTEVRKEIEADFAERLRRFETAVEKFRRSTGVSLDFVDEDRLRNVWKLGTAGDRSRDVRDVEFLARQLRETADRLDRTATELAAIGDEDERKDDE